MLPEKIYFEKCHAYTVQYTNFNKIIIFVLFSGIIHPFLYTQVGWYSEDDGLNIKENVFPDLAALSTTTAMVEPFFLTAL
jgi:hypothetical protein